MVLISWLLAMSIVIAALTVKDVLSPYIGHHFS